MCHQILLRYRITAVETDKLKNLRIAEDRLSMGLFRNISRKTNRIEGILLSLNLLYSPFCLLGSFIEKSRDCWKAWQPRHISQKERETKGFDWNFQRAHRARLRGLMDKASASYGSAR